MKDRKILWKAIAHYGKKEQMQMAIEEMSELTKEICKRFRGADNWNAIAEEAADVEITLEQLKLIGGIGGQVEVWKEQKLKRLEERINNNE